MEDLERRVIEVEQRAKSNSHRIDDLEADNKALQKLATSVELMAKNMENMAKEQEKQGTRLEALEKEPAKQWNSMKRTIFTTLLSTISGGLIGAVLALILK